MTRPPVASSGSVERPHDLLPRRLARRAASSPIVRRVTVMASHVQEAGLGEALRDEARAAGRVQVGRDEAPARLEVGEERHAPR